jgi:hypothetical protein
VRLYKNDKELLGKIALGQMFSWHLHFPCHFSLHKLSHISKIGGVQEDDIEGCRLLECDAVSPILVTLMMEAIRSSQTTVLARATRRHISEDCILHVPQLLIMTSSTL